MMFTRTHRGLSAPAVIAVLASLALAAGSAAVLGQENPDPAAKAPPAAQAQPAPHVQPATVQPATLQPATAQPTAVRNNPAELRATQAQATDFVGPPEPRSAAMQPQITGQLGVSKGAASDVPAPTVVLQPGEAPAITFDTPTWDWGRIRSGPDIAHDFWFTNTGTGPLEILKVRPG